MKTLYKCFKDCFPGLKESLSSKSDRASINKEIKSSTKQNSIKNINQIKLWLFLKIVTLMKDTYPLINALEKGIFRKQACTCKSCIAKWRILKWQQNVTHKIKCADMEFMVWLWQKNYFLNLRHVLFIFLNLQHCCSCATRSIAVL